MKKQEKQTVKARSKPEMRHIDKVSTCGRARVGAHDYYAQLRQIDDNDTDNAIRTLRRIKAK